MTEPTSEEIQAALEEFLEELPESIENAIFVGAENLDVGIAMDIRSGAKFLVVVANSPESEEYPRGSNKIKLALDEDSATKLLHAVYAMGSEVWGEEDEDDDGSAG